MKVMNESLGPLVALTGRSLSLGQSPAIYVHFPIISDWPALTLDPQPHYSPVDRRLGTWILHATKISPSQSFYSGGQAGCLCDLVRITSDHPSRNIFQYKDLQHYVKIPRDASNHTDLGHLQLTLNTIMNPRLVHPMQDSTPIDARAIWTELDSINQ